MPTPLIRARRTNFFRPVAKNFQTKKIQLQPQVKQIIPGNTSTLFLHQDGKVWGSGKNGFGQLGIGISKALAQPVQVPLENIKEVIAGEGGLHTFFLKNNGTIWACGRNHYDQLGIGNFDQQNQPIQVRLEGVNKIIAKDYHTLFQKNDGTVWACGNNYFGMLGIGNFDRQNHLVQAPLNDVNQIFAGKNHTFFLKNNGTIWACGYNEDGQLGIGNFDRQNQPVQVPLENVKQVIAGAYHTFFLKNDDTIWACGHNKYGQLGIGSFDKQNQPVQLCLDGVKQIIAENYHTLFLKNDDTVWACGDNLHGQLGTRLTAKQNQPAQVPLTNVKQITTKKYQTFFLKNNDTVWACGNNSFGQLGIDNSAVLAFLNILKQSILRQHPLERYIVRQPKQVPLNEVKQVFAGVSYTFFLKNDGTVWGCGSNNSGELGVGNFDNQNLPQLLQKYQKLQAIQNELLEKDSQFQV